MPCHAWPSVGCCDICNTSRAPSLQRIPFIELAGPFPGINISLQIFHLSAIPWSLITWRTLLICLDAFPGFMIKLTSPVSSTRLRALSQISPFWGEIAECSYYFRDISGDVWFLNHQQSCLFYLFIYLFFNCFHLEEDVRSRESETCEKAPSETEQMVSNGKSLCLPLWSTTAGHR